MLSNKMTKIEFKFFLVISISVILSFTALAYNYNYDYRGLPIMIAALAMIGLLVYKKRFLLFGAIASAQFILLTFAAYFYFNQVGYEHEAYSLLIILIIQIGIMPFIWNRLFLRGIIVNSLFTFLLFDFFASLVSLQFALDNGGRHFQYFWLAFILSSLMSYATTTLSYRKVKNKSITNADTSYKLIIKDYFGDRKYRVYGNLAFLDNTNILLLLTEISHCIDSGEINKLRGYTVIFPSDEEAIKTLKVKDKMRPDMAPIEILSIPKNKVYSFINEL
jgi:hypothetical protein